MEWGMPVGKYQRSPSLTSATKLFPFRSRAVIRALPYSMNAHSAAACQCNSRMPPAVSRMSTPAIDFETGSSRTVTSRDQPASYMRLWAREKGYLKTGTDPASVAGGAPALGFSDSIAGLVGPASCLLLSVAACGFAEFPSEEADRAPTVVARAVELARKRRRESLFMASLGLEFTLLLGLPGMERKRPFETALTPHLDFRVPTRIEGGTGRDYLQGMNRWLSGLTSSVRMPSLRAFAIARSRRPSSSVTLSSSRRRNIDTAWRPS